MPHTVLFPGVDACSRSFAAIGQELAFIGLDLDANALHDVLDSAALTDDELTAGPAPWARYPDPFPAH